MAGRHIVVRVSVGSQGMEMSGWEEYIDWRWPLTSVHSVMMVFLAQLGEGGGEGVHPTPVTLSTLSTPPPSQQNERENATCTLHLAPSFFVCFIKGASFLCVHSSITVSLRKPITSIESTKDDFSAVGLFDTLCL